MPVDMARTAVAGNAAFAVAVGSAVAGGAGLLHDTPMPLRCLDDRRESLDAAGFDETGWVRLAADNRRRRHLRTPCCDAPVAVKTSPLGTRFFAHVGGGCATADESPEHLQLKVMAVDAARRHGWAASTEIGGTTPTGEAWQADVLASRGRHRIAVEVQWSPQADDETLRRQARYAVSGVRALWLFRQPGFPQSREVPAVRVGGDLRTGFTALGRPLAEVLDAAFAGRLKFGLPVGAGVRVKIVGAVLECWQASCTALNRVVVGIEIVGGRNACSVALPTLGEYPGPLAAMLGRLPADVARGAIARRPSRAKGLDEFVNSCFVCGATISNAYVAAATNRDVVASFAAIVDDGWAAAIAVAPRYAPVWDVAPPAASA